ncbi:MAG: hypothetical protein ABEK16_05880 [Candidatus Nanohalobium sp.]
MVSEDFLKERAESAAEELTEGVEVENTGEKTVKIDKRNEFDEKLEKDIETDEGVWSSEEVEYLVNNRHKMGNDELKEFLNRNSDFQHGEFERFSEAEEEVIMRNFPMHDVEELSEKLDRPEKQVEKKIKMLGLGNKLE